MSTALTRFIAPLITVTPRPAFVPQLPPHPEKDKKERKDAPPAQLKIVPRFDDPIAAALPDTPSEKAAGPEESQAQSFTQLFLLFQEQRTRMIHSWGRACYRESAEKRRRTGNFRKGAMLDDRAE